MTTKRIPYGISDYGRIQRENCYYVDKTHYIPMIEAAPFYLFCIRPRRIGKSLWLSLMQHYYDINEAENFDLLFGDTYIGQNPTPDRNRYLILFFNFALVSPEMEKVQESFHINGCSVVQAFLKKYERFFDPEVIAKTQIYTDVTDQLREVFTYATSRQLKIYLFIDEYDNFTNTILSSNGPRAYHELTRGTGFYRYFFNLLKGATGGQMSGLDRLFITGVSPITMDDVTSGFNIGTNISLSPRYNEIMGLTESEVKQMLTYFDGIGELALDMDIALTLMKEWYNNYYFSRRAETAIYNSDMVFHFLVQSQENNGVPENLVDQNIRTDYNKLRHLMIIDSQLSDDQSEDGEPEDELSDAAQPTKVKLNGNFSQLQTIIEEGEIISPINPSFPLDELLNQENFISLLYYFGLLSFAGTVRGLPLLRIPNRTVKDLMYGYIRSSLADAEMLKLNIRKLSNLLSNMAYQGQWKQFFDYMNSQVEGQASVRDHLNGEKVLQGFMLAYLNVTHHFHTWSEREMGGGFVDFYLEPFVERFPDIEFGYLVELKHLSEKQFNSEQGPKLFAKKISDAEEQLRQYANDARIREIAEQLTLKKIILVYKGWELAYAEEMDI